MLQKQSQILKIIGKQEAKEFFETNKKCLVDGFLDYTIKKMERCVSTEFTTTVTFNKNIKIESDVYIGAFKASLSELIINALKEFNTSVTILTQLFKSSKGNSISNV